jgi:putative flippase GtrA
LLSEASNGLIGQIGRFSIAGVINTAFGYVVIFGGMALGLSPYVSNFAGYLIGLFCSFFLGRRFVFLASGNSGRQLVRFFITFCIAYFFNLGTLYFCLQLGVNNLVSQVIAGVIYLIVMFAFSRIWVFK